MAFGPKEALHHHAISPYGRMGVYANIFCEAAKVAACCG